MDGFLNLLKPPGMTSSDAVLAVRRALPRGTRVGHGGTLDPDAAGVLPVCVGKATRLFDYFIDKEKRYVAEAVFGITTDTQDASGKVLKRGEIAPSEQEILGALSEFVGEIWQTPPAYSAIKQGGRRLYDLARKGVEAEIAPRRVRVVALDYLGRTGYNRYMFSIACRKGVYVRTLMHDLGEKLGCGAHMSFLLRTRAGAFRIEETRLLEEIASTGVSEDMLLPMDYPIAHLREMRLGEDMLGAVRNGRPLEGGEGLASGECLRVYVADRFAGIGQYEEDGMVHCKAMLL